MNLVEVTIRVGDAEATKKLDAVKEKLRAFGRTRAAADVTVRVSDSQARAKLDEIEARLRVFGHTKAEAKVSIKGAAKTAAETAALGEEVRKLGGKNSGILGKATSGFLGMAESMGNAGSGLINPMTIAMGGLATVLAGPLIAALLPITLGFAGLAAVAIPFFGKLKTDLSSVSAATEKYRAASENLNIAIHKSPNDMHLYQQSLVKVEPDMRNAAKLLTDQNVRWQNLTPSMQASVVALSNNKGVLKGLLPDQKAALTALLAQKAAWDDLTPAQQKMTKSMQGIGQQWRDLNKAVQPQLIRIFGNALKVIRDMMPALKPLINAAAKALGDFLGKMDNWLRSSSGKKFMHWLETQGPADIAQFGKVLWNVGRAIGQTFEFLNWAGNTWWHKFKTTCGDVEQAARNLKQWLWNDFVMKLVTFFTRTLPTAVDILRTRIRIAWDQIVIHSEGMVLKILEAMSHIPFIGHRFAQAADAVKREMTRMQADVRSATGRIQGDFDRLHSHPVSLNISGHVTLPGDPIGRTGKAGFAKGTSGAPPGWAMVGEEGPELIHMKGGETVLPHHASMRAVRGFAGGTVGANFSDTIRPPVGVMGSRIIRYENSAVAAIEKAARKILTLELAGSGAAIARYASRFAGTPYVWGGTTPRGWDCSGFTSWVYHHFGIPAPRTSEQQQRWAQPSRDVPGALAFFYGRNGGASHVGISLGGGRMINAEDPARGTRFDSSGGNSGFGIPPGGFGRFGLRGGLGAVGGGTAVELGRAMAAQFGWRGGQWNALFRLWQRESGWSPNAVNPSSGAYGIPQALGHGHPYNLGDARGQIAWGLRYILSRYGSPVNAWGHEQRSGWYDNGGWLPPGRSIAINNTGRPERVVGPNEKTNVKLVIDVSGGNADMKRLIRKWVRDDGGGDVQVAFGSDV